MLPRWLVLFVLVAAPPAATSVPLAEPITSAALCISTPDNAFLGSLLSRDFGKPSLSGGFNRYSTAGGGLANGTKAWGLPVVAVYIGVTPGDGGIGILFGAPMTQVADAVRDSSGGGVRLFSDGYQTNPGASIYQITPGQTMLYCA